MLWGSMRLISEARLESLWSVPVCVQPHHLANDFQPLLAAVERGFKFLSSQHKCPLMAALPLIVVDGKWCMQVSLCNDRFSRQIWNTELQLGSFSGCTDRPQRGSKYCERHVPAELPEDAGTLPEIVQHRDDVRNGKLVLEFQLGDGSWVAADSVPPQSVRRYELGKLPQCSRRGATSADSTCSRDPLRGTPEPLVNRKSGGILVAVGPCLHIVDVTPMYSSESRTQVVMFVWSIVQRLCSLQWVVYDFACGIVQFLASQRSRRQGAAADGWRSLQGLHWVLDKLHFHGHTCRDESSANYNPDVNPYVTRLQLATTHIPAFCPTPPPASALHLSIPAEPHPCQGTPTIDWHRHGSGRAGVQHCQQMASQSVQLSCREFSDTAPALHA